MGIGRVELDQLLLRVWGIIDLGVWHALREHSLREDRVRSHITRLVTPRGSAHIRNNTFRYHEHGFVCSMYALYRTQVLRKGY